MKQVHCPECGRAWENDGSLAGQMVVCPNCTEVFAIPGDPSQGPVSAQPPSALDCAGDGCGEPAPPVRPEGRQIAAPPVVIAPPAPPLPMAGRQKPSPPPIALAAAEPASSDPVDMDMAPQARFLVHTLLGVAFFLIALISVIYLVGWMRHSVVVAQVARRDKPTVEWIADLQGHEAAARGKAAEAIVQQGAPAVAEALDAIIAIQSDGSYRVVRLAVQALAARGTEIIQPLREALRSKRAGVRIGAVSVLREMGTKAKGAVRPLSDALGDDNRWVRRLAIESLGNCGAYAASATPQLIPLLTHEDRVTRLRTVIALTQIAPAAQVASDRLVAVRDHDADPEIRQAAVTALYQVDLERLAKEADEQASDEVRALVKRLAGKDPADRVLAARALGAKGLGALYAMPALAKALGDSDKWLREAAAKALGSMGDAAEPAVPNLQRLATDPEPDVQTAAQQALKEIRGKNL